VITEVSQDADFEEITVESSNGVEALLDGK
jgi:hypothetical protein